MLAENDSRGVQYSVAIVTEEESSFPEMRRVLAPTFQTVLASTEKQIRARDSEGQGPEMRWHCLRSWMGRSDASSFSGLGSRIQSCEAFMRERDRSPSEWEVS